MTLPAGLKLGPYEVIAPLGAGGMGEVYRARDPRLNRDVALKVLPEAFAADADRLRRFEQEARAAGSLNHPNIIAVHDFGSHDGATYVVSELLEGETLRGRLASGALAPRRAVDYALQIAHGLAAAHEKGIVHRDLKPENLFLTEDGRVKILDFGLAKLVQPEAEADRQTSIPTVSRGTEPGVVLGTVGYMSPEQVRGMPADQRSDIFSFGAVLYEMLSGRRAFRGDSPVETMSAIIREDPPELSESGRNLSPGLERLVRHCLEKSPAQRFQSAHDLAYDLEALSESSGATVAPRALAAPVAKRRLLWPGFAALALAVGLVAGFLASSRFRPSKAPTYKQLTFRRGLVGTSRFAPDGHTVLYSAAWNGERPRIYSTRPESPESSPLALPDSTLLAVSRSGEIALALNAAKGAENADYSTLSRVPLSGGAPREILKGVDAADLDADGRQLAVARRVAGRVQIEFPIGTVVYRSKGDIASIRVSPRGDRLAFADHPVHGDTAGSVMTLDRGQVKMLATGWYDLGQVSWSADGREVWFSASRTGSRRALWAVDLSGKARMIANVPGSVDIQDVGPDGTALLGHYTFRSSIIGLAQGESAEREFSWLDFSVPVELGTDARTLLFEEWGEGGGGGGGVYLSRIGQGQPVRLGDGVAVAMSPDQQWVLSCLYTEPRRLVLLPTGAGQVTPVPGEGIPCGEVGAWLPDGKRILFAGQEGGAPLRLFVQDVSGGNARAFTGEVAAAEQLGPIPVSPDGKFVAWLDAGRRVLLYPLDGGEPRPAAGVEQGERPMRWSADGRHLFVARLTGLTYTVVRVDPFSGKRETWRELKPSDPTGVMPSNSGAVLSADGKSYFWGVQRRLDELYLVEGLR